MISLKQALNHQLKCQNVHRFIKCNQDLVKIIHYINK